MSRDCMLDHARREVLVNVAQRHGTPSFVYFMDDVQARISQLRGAFGNRFAVSYAMKCNPNPGLLSWMRDHADTLDVSSAGELRAGLKAGWAPERISFTGPAKQRADLELAVREGIGEVVVESVREAIVLDEEARAADTIQKVLIRIAPAHVPRGFGSNMSGKPTQFGIDEENLTEEVQTVARLRNLTVAGFHAYSGTQCLKADAIAENWLNFLRLFELGSEMLDIRPEKLIFGSGLGIRYHDGDSAIALPDVATAVAPALDRVRSMPRYSATQFTLETGRFLVGEAGVYLARVVHTKMSRGSRIVVLDGGMNHHLGAAGHLGMIIHRPYRMEVIAAHASAESSAEPQDIYGPLCTTIDTLGRGVKLPPLGVGDLLVVHCSGAYGPSSSPAGFISHPRAREFMVTGGPDAPELRDWSVD